MNAKAEIQKLADLYHAQEYWRTHDAYPHERWRSAEKATREQLYAIMRSATSLPPSPSLSALTALEC